jgi:hypothetical protein
MLLVTTAKMVFAAVVAKAAELQLELSNSDTSLNSLGLLSSITSPSASV